MNDSNHNGGPVQDGLMQDGPQIPQDESLSFTKLTAMIIGSTIAGMPLKHLWARSPCQRPVRSPLRHALRRNLKF